MLAEKLYTDGAPFASGWNFGPAEDDAHPVEWIAKRLVAQWGDGASWQLDGVIQPHEATYLKLDSSKARESLDWQPKLSLDEVLEWLVEWYQQWHRTDKISLRELTLQQITKYEAKESLNHALSSQ